MTDLFRRTVAALLTMALISASAVAPGWTRGFASAPSSVPPARSFDVQALAALAIWQRLPPFVAYVPARIRRMIKTDQALDPIESGVARSTTLWPALAGLAIGTVGIFIFGLFGVLNMAFQEDNASPPDIPDHTAFVRDTHPEQFRQSFSGLRASMGTTGEDVLNPNYLHALGIYGYLFALDRIASTPGARPIRVIISGDPRPSRAALEKALIRGLRAAASESGRQIEVINLGVMTTPLTEAAIRTLETDGAIMITASHNPLKDNGVKFMTAVWEARGAVLTPSKMRDLIRQFEALRSDKQRYEIVSQRLVRENPEAVRVTPPASDDMERIFDAYLSELRTTFDGVDLDAVLRDFSIIIDTNGGAGSSRIFSPVYGVVAWVLKRFGMDVLDVNSTLGIPSHHLEPAEGTDGLSSMQERWEQLHQKYPKIFGVVFDWDADRGTTAPQTDPQTVAALNVAMMLSWMDAYHQADHTPVVIVASDATSHRVEQIASNFSRAGRPVSVVRVETGEINVVMAMQRERDRGHYVPIGVEGPNGGTILGTGTCRDGLSTAILTAIGLNDPKVRAEWSNHVENPQQQERLEGGDITLRDLVSTLPPRRTRLGIKRDLAVSVPFLKQALENEFRRRWLSSAVMQFEYPSYRFTHFEEGKQFNNLADDGLGGWLLSLRRSDDTENLIWVRPSRTEPVLRYQIDAEDRNTSEQLEKLFEEMYARVNQPALEQTTYQAGSELLYERSVVFSIREDTFDQAWEASRDRKRQQLLNDFPLSWNRELRVTGMPAGLIGAFTDLIKRRRIWYLNTVPVTDPLYVELTSEDSLMQNTLSRPLTDVIAELATNAFDAYTRAHVQGGIVNLRVTKEGSRIRIDLSDNGVGISQIQSAATGALEVLSKPAPDEAWLSRIEGGLGIGIPWSQILAVMHGGNLEYFMRGLDGFRTTARLNLPREAVRHVVSEPNTSEGSVAAGLLGVLAGLSLGVSALLPFVDSIELIACTGLALSIALSLLSFGPFNPKRGLPPFHRNLHSAA